MALVNSSLNYPSFGFGSGAGTFAMPAGSTPTAGGSIGFSSGPGTFPYTAPAGGGTAAPAPAPTATPGQPQPVPLLNYAPNQPYQSFNVGTGPGTFPYAPTPATPAQPQPTVAPAPQGGGAYGFTTQQLLNDPRAFNSAFQQYQQQRVSEQDAYLTQNPGFTFSPLPGMTQQQMTLQGPFQPTVTDLMRRAGINNAGIATGIPWGPLTNNPNDPSNPLGGLPPYAGMPGGPPLNDLRNPLGSSGIPGPGMTVDQGGFGLWGNPLAMTQGAQGLGGTGLVNPLAGPLNGYGLGMNDLGQILGYMMVLSQLQNFMSLLGGAGNQGNIMSPANDWNYALYGPQSRAGLYGMP